MDKYESHDPINTSKKQEKISNTPVIASDSNDKEIVTVNEGEDTISNNLRGFKLKNQRTNADLTTEVHTERPHANNTDISSRNDSKHDQKSDRHDEAQSRRYCHFYSNTGQCDYESRTGLKCKFSHKKAPMCRLGTSCNRSKCMFSHPKVNNDFLSRQVNMMQMMNPWQIGNTVNPWLCQINPQWQNLLQQVQPTN